MKISKSKLNQIIKEEIDRLISEHGEEAKQQDNPVDQAIAKARTIMAAVGETHVLNNDEFGDLYGMILDFVVKREGLERVEEIQR